VEFATKIVGLQLAGREGKAAYFRSDKAGCAVIRATTRWSISRAIRQISHRLRS